MKRVTGSAKHSQCSMRCARRKWNKLIAAIRSPPAGGAVAKPTLARHLGEFASNLHFGQLPPAALALAKLGVSDCIAVMVAGSREAAVQTLRKTLASLGGPAE